MTRDFDADRHAPTPSADWRATLRLGYAVIILTFGGFGGWAAVARLDSAVVASGAISNESNRRTVQHLEGGIVRELLVRDGSTVREGDLLLRLDPTRNEAVSGLYRKQLAAALASEARLIAQREMMDTVTFSPEVLALAADPLVASAKADNERLFESRRANLLGSLNIVETQIAQAEKELAQTRIEKRTAEDQLESLNQELPGIRSLYAKGLVALNRLTTLEREELRLKGAIESATVALTKGADKITELRARGEQVKGEYRQDAATQLTDIGKAISDLRQQIIIAEDAVKRIDIRAPVSGSVQQLRIFTVGGVVKPGDPILDIIPEADTLVIRAKVTPMDVDRVREDLPVEIRLPQFTKFHSAVIQGRVRHVARDSVKDENKREYFALEATVDRSTIPPEILDRLVSGMNVDVLVRTEQRTALQYFVAPIWNRLHSSMRER